MKIQVDYPHAGNMDKSGYKLKALFAEIVLIKNDRKNSLQSNNIFFASN